MRKNTNYKIIIIALIVGALIGSFVTYSFVLTPASIRQQISTVRLDNPKSSIAEINLAAVDRNGKGAVTGLIVEAKPGTGKILTDIDKLLFWVDTQQSIQIAKAVAQNVTGINADNYDIIYTIAGDNISLVGGPSAGAAITLATIAVLKNETVPEDIMITGTIEPDGSIGEVGGILEKAKAAREIGTTLFLVPDGEGIQTYLKPEENCSRVGGFIYCETTYRQITVNIGNNVGIDVKEVSDIYEALKYFNL